MKMKVFWVRHGKTELNTGRHYYGKLDVRLSPEGVDEIKAIETDFDNCSNVYTSSSARAIETASLLFQNIYFKTDARLQERHMGIFEGLDYEAIKKKYPYEVKEWEVDWKEFVIPEGESARMQYERTKSFIKELEAIGEDAVVITHAGTIRMALCYMLGENLDLFWRFKVDTGIVVSTTCYDHYWYMEMARKYY